MMVRTQDFGVKQDESNDALPLRQQVNNCFIFTPKCIYYHRFFPIPSVNVAAADGSPRSASLGAQPLHQVPVVDYF